jgi:DNA-binding PadR family transcriptional regulator
MAAAPRLSRQTVAVVAELLAEPAAWRYGYDLMRTTGLAAGTLYPLLTRLADHGWLERRWEERGESGRPPRQLYRLTAAGVREARALRERAAARAWTAGDLLHGSGA